MKSLKLQFLNFEISSRILSTRVCHLLSSSPLRVICYFLSLWKFFQVQKECYFISHLYPTRNRHTYIQRYPLTKWIILQQIKNIFGTNVTVHQSTNTSKYAT